MRFSFVEQIRSQFMIYFMMPNLGVAINSLNCIVSFTDADFRSFDLLEIISERDVPICEIYST